MFLQIEMSCSHSSCDAAGFDVFPLKRSSGFVNVTVLERCDNDCEFTAIREIRVRSATGK